MKLVQACLQVLGVQGPFETETGGIELIESGRGDGGLLKFILDGIQGLGPFYREVRGKSGCGQNGDENEAKEYSIHILLLWLL